MQETTSAWLTRTRSGNSVHFSFSSSRPRDVTDKAQMNSCDTIPCQPSWSKGDVTVKMSDLELDSPGLIFIEYLWTNESSELERVSLGFANSER